MIKLFYFAFIFLSIITAGAQDLKPYTVYLKEGTILRNLKDKSEVVLPRGIYAKALELNPKKRNHFYVYNQNGSAIYETDASGLVEVADDLRLLPNVNAEKIHPPRSVLKTSDKIALFDSQISIHFDNFQITPFNEVYSDEMTSVIAPRYEARTLYTTNFPIKFGFGLNYQSAYWKNDYEAVKLSILSVGPQFRYNFYESEGYNAHALLGAEYALIYQGSTALFTDEYSAQLYDLGVESEWLRSFGIITFGAHFRHHEVALSKSDRVNLQLTPKEFSVNSLGVMLGYKIEWEL